MMTMMMEVSEEVKERGEFVFVFVLIQRGMKSSLKNYERGMIISLKTK